MLSIIIVNWNTCSVLRDCLKSLLEHPAECGQEIIVIDNASTDASAEMVRNEFSNVQLVENDFNAGYSSANNQGIRMSVGDYILLLNPDTEVKPFALSTAVEYLKNNKEVGAVGAKLIHPDGRVQASCRSFPAPMPVLWEYLGISKLFPSSKFFSSYRMRWFDYSFEIEVDQPMGTFLMVTKEAIKRVGLMDEQFPIFFNEVDWLFRLRKTGLRTMFLPQVEVIHHGGESTKQVRKAMIWESHKSLLKFYRKHYSVIWLLLLAPFVWMNAFIKARGYHKGFK